MTWATAARTTSASAHRSVSYTSRSTPSPRRHLPEPRRNTPSRGYSNFNQATGPATTRTLALEQPQQVVLGVAYDIIPNKLLVEVNGKWLNWGNADGYKDFGWKDQWVAAVGMQAKPMDWLAIRMGYNYGNNPVKQHNGFNFLGTTRHPRHPDQHRACRGLQDSRLPGHRGTPRDRWPGR